MRHRLSVSVLFALLAFSAGTAAAAPACYNPAEVRAAQVRRLHIEMQVAALQCRDADPGLPGLYGAYVRKFGPALADNARVLKGHFSRNYGREGERRFDRYVTQLANDASRQSRRVDDFCDAQTPLLETVLQLKPAQLEAFAVKMIDDPAGPGPCPQEVKKAKPAASPSSAAKPASASKPSSASKPASSPPGAGKGRG